MAAYSAFKKLCVGAGLDAKRFGLHSLRAGATTDAFKNEVPGHLIDLRGRWRSANTKNRYCRPDVTDLLLVHRYTKF
jgi:hypothetical protein